jgi:hypothetical protein
MKRSSKVFLCVFLAIIVFATVYFSISRTKLERDMAIDFTVEKVEITPALRAVLYDKDRNKLRLQRFVFFERHGIQPNDIVVKEAGAEFLKVYRMDSLGNKTVHLRMKIE